MYQYEAETLQAITMIGGIARRPEVIDMAGYAHGTVDRALVHLTRQGAVERSYRGGYRLTERGKIALAIWQGQQQRRRAGRTRIDTERGSSIYAIPDAASG